MLRRRDGQAIGSPDTVRRDLGRLIAETEADELMLTTHVYGPRTTASARSSFAREQFRDAPLGLQQG